MRKPRGKRLDERYEAELQEWQQVDHKFHICYLLIQLAIQYQEDETAKAFAEFIGVDPAALNRWFKENKLPTRAATLGIAPNVAKNAPGHPRLAPAKINELLRAIGEKELSDEEFAEYGTEATDWEPWRTHFTRATAEGLLDLIDRISPNEAGKKVVTLRHIREEGITGYPKQLVDRLFEPTSPIRKFIRRQDGFTDREAIVLTSNLTGEVRAQLIEMLCGERASLAQEGSTPIPFKFFATQISALDRLLGGGLRVLSKEDKYQGLTIVIDGPPGAGKSTLALSLCVEWAKQGRHSLYCSLEQPADGLKHTVRHLGLAPDKREWEWQQEGEGGMEWPKRGAVKVTELVAEDATFNARLELLLRYLEKMRTDLPGIVVIDSLNVMTQLDLYRSNVLQLKRALARRNVIALFTLESGASTDRQEAMEKFLADVVIELNTVFDQDYLLRTLEIKKARYQFHALGKHFMKIRSKAEMEENHPGGIHIFPSLHFQLYETRKDDKARQKAAVQMKTVSNELRYLHTGIPTLDQIIAPGLKARSTTALLGPIGPLKKAIALSFLAEGLQRGEHVVLFSTAANAADVLNLPIFSGDTRIDLKREKERLLTVKAFQPGFITPEEFVGQIIETIHTADATSIPIPVTRVMFDSIAQMPLSFSLVAASRVFLPTLMDILALQGITSIFLAVADEDSSNALNHGLLIRADNAIVLSRTADYQHELQVLKLAERFTDSHPRRVRQDENHKITIEPGSV